MTLLRRNAELARINVWNWTLPAWVVRRDDGTHYNVCPSAGACAKVCYARNGTYLFPKVRASHLRNLEATMPENLPTWEAAMLEELTAARFRPTGEPRTIPGIDTDDLDGWARRWARSGGAAERIHDAGTLHPESRFVRTRAYGRTGVAITGGPHYGTGSSHLIHGTTKRECLDALWAIARAAELGRQSWR